MRFIRNIILSFFIVFFGMIALVISALVLYGTNIEQKSNECEARGGTYIQTTGFSHKCVDLKEIR